MLQGRWKGAIVAIKVIDHRLKGNDMGMDIQRESMLSTSIVHPNVVSCGPAHLHPGQLCPTATVQGRSCWLVARMPVSMCVCVHLPGSCLPLAHMPDGASRQPQLARCWVPARMISLQATAPPVSQHCQVVLVR